MRSTGTNPHSLPRVAIDILTQRARVWGRLPSSISSCWQGDGAAPLVMLFPLGAGAQPGTKHEGAALSRKTYTPDGSLPSLPSTPIQTRQLLKRKGASDS